MINSITHFESICLYAFNMIIICHVSRVKLFYIVARTRGLPLFYGFVTHNLWSRQVDQDS
jgi:hypothetical protein